MTPLRWLRRGILAWGLAACSSDGATTPETPSSPVRSITIAAPSLPLTIGNAVTLTATAIGTGGAKVDTAAITWSSSNPGAAPVSTNGQVTALGAGTATITARDGSVSASVSITVTSAALAALIVTGAPPDSVAVGTTDTLRVAAIDANENPVVPPAVTWRSSDPVVATVSASGVVTASAHGSATISASTGTINGSAVVLVKGPPVGQILVTTLSASLPVGGVVQLAVTARDTAGNRVAPPPITWSSSQPAVASVLATGLVTAHAVGTATIAATAGILHAEAIVVVGSDRIDLAGPAGALTLGSTYQFTALVRLTDGTTVAGVPLTWGSTNPAVATVGSDGTVTPYSPGQTTISATDGRVTGVFSVVVAVGPVAVAILPAAATLLVAPGQSLRLTPIEYYVTFTLPTVVPGQVTWSSDDVSIAAVDATGKVTGVTPGITTIRAMIDQHPAAQTVQVMATPGTATIRMISAADDFPQVTMHPNSGTAVTLAYGTVSEQTVPAGALQLSLDGIPPLLSFYDTGIFDVQVFYGTLPAGSRQTFVAVSNASYTWYSGPAEIAWLTDRADAVPADSSAVRALLATNGGYNVFFTPPGGGMTLLALQGCYLDWPFGYTGYSDRVPGDFDIVLQGGKFDTNGPEVARFHVTAQAGHAMTFIITGKDSTSLRVVPVVDR